MKDSARKKKRRRSSDTPFKDRDEEINSIMSSVSDAPLLDIYGVAGIGKSRLIEEAGLQLRDREPQAVLIQVDLMDLPPDPPGRPEAFLRSLIAQEPTRLQGAWQNTEQVAAEVVVQLNDIASRLTPAAPVYLFVDTTEVVQEDMGFWSWMENNLVSPLVVTGQVRQVFAGRIPVPWRRFEVRRAVKLLSLGPLPQEEAARELIIEILQKDPNLSPKDIQKAAYLLTELSFGHPRLSEELATYGTSHLPQALQQPEAFQRELSEQVVVPFVDSYLFEDIPAPWPEILKWASVLHQFDPLLLRRYLIKVDESLVADKQDYFFVQGLAMLRIRYATIWHAGEGTVVHGILRDILRRNLQILRPDDFRRACQAAADVYDELADEFPSDSEEASRYRDEAEQYRSESQNRGSREENNR
jgi:hypothetical protein